MATPLVFLPAELWLHVLRQHTDPLHLWLSCRQVSKEWRNEVNKIFAVRYLQDPRMTELMFDLGRWHKPLTMYFNRFDPVDPTRCIFAENPSPFDLTDKEKEAAEQPSSAVDLQEVSFNEQIRILKGRGVLASYDTVSNGVRGAGRFDEPLHTIRVKRLVNDTELPGISVDYDKQEVSFRWLELFECMYREQRALHRMLLRSADQHPCRPTDDGCTPLVAIRGLFRECEDIRKQIRRKRIVLWYKEKIGWNMHEFAISLASQRFAIERIDAAKHSLDCRAFPEDADEERAALKQIVEQNMLNEWASDEGDSGHEYNEGEDFVWKEDAEYEWPNDEEEEA